LSIDERNLYRLSGMMRCISFFHFCAAIALSRIADNFSLSQLNE